MKKLERSLDKVHYFFGHGFNDWSRGQNTTDKLVRFFTDRGVPQSNCHEFDYEHLFIIGTYVRTHALARKLADEINAIGKPVVFVGHSHGNVIAYLAAKEYGANIIYQVCINPALNVDTVFADSVHMIDTYFSAGDNVVALSKLVPFHWWGEAGRTGFQPKGNDKHRHRKFSMSNPPKAETPKVKSHSGVFKDRNLRFYGSELAERTIDTVDQLMKEPPKSRNQKFTKAMTRQLVFALSEGYDVEFEGVRALKLSLSKKGNPLTDEELTEFVELWKKSGGINQNELYTLKPERLIA